MGTAEFVRSLPQAYFGRKAAAIDIRIYKIIATGASCSEGGRAFHNKLATLHMDRVAGIDYCTISTVAGPGVTRDTVCC